MSGNYINIFFFFKQKTAYEMRISDWSSDVCSSDLDLEVLDHRQIGEEGAVLGHVGEAAARESVGRAAGDRPAQALHLATEHLDETGAAQERSRILGADGSQEGDDLARVDAQVAATHNGLAGVDEAGSVRWGAGHG